MGDGRYLFPGRWIGGVALVVGKTYGAAHVVAALNPAIMFGWPVLALGAWRAGVLPWWRALALAAMAALMLGVLKGSTRTSVACLSGLAVALVPLGVRVLLDGHRPRPAAVAAWAVGVPAPIALAYLIGRLG